MTSATHKLNAHLLLITVVASLGGLLFGFDTAVIAGTTKALTALYHLSPLTLGVTVSSALLGTIIGAAFAGVLSDRFGRRSCLRVLALLYFISALGCALAWGWNALLVFRVISGVAIGGSSVISPTYIAEISPARLRGRLVGFFQFNVVFGILLAYLSNFCVGRLHLGGNDWRWKLGMAALPALFFFVALFRIPESPRWLVRQGRTSEALSVLQANGEDDAAQEVREMAVSATQRQESPAGTLFQSRYRLPIFLAVSIGLFNQLSGVNAILYYLNSIFEKAGFDQVSSDLQAVMIGATNLIAVTIAMFVIDRIGRKLLLLIGSVGTALCLAGVGYVMYVQRYQSSLVWLLVGFIGFFSFSQGAVIWVYISEIFPNSVRGKGQSIGSFTHWIMNAAVSLLFPLAAANWGAMPFFFFSLAMVAQFFVVLFIYPETRGVSLEKMEVAIHG
jgi:SP family arabinose:H+ symporter-like MFS transporter